jgi:CheY-like chemotaxis protein
MVEDEIQHLRVLIANERRDRLELLAQVVAGLGHEVIAREVDVTAVAAVTAREQPDVALVGLGLSSQHALELIEQIVHESSCPVIALLSAEDPAYVREATKRGVFGYLVDTTPEELQSAIDVTLQRFTEYHNLQGRSGGAHLGRTRFEDTALFEAGVPEDPEHLGVVAHYLGEELFDADTRGQRGETLEQTRRDAASLKLVRHGKGNLGGVRIAQTYIARERDDEIVLRTNKGTPFDPLGLEHRLDEALVHARITVEAEVEALAGEAAEELEQRRRIFGLRRAKAHGRPVAENDVGNGLDKWIKRWNPH